MKSVYKEKFDEAENQLKKGNFSWIETFLDDMKTSMIMDEKASIIESAYLEARILLITAELSTRKGEHKKSLEISSIVPELAKSDDLKIVRAKYHNLTGDTHRKLAEYEKAMVHLENALSLFNELHEREGVAEVLGNMAIVYFELSQYDKAIDVSEDAKLIYEELGNISGIAKVLGNIGIGQKELGNLSMALTLFEKAYDLHEKLGNHTWKGIVSMNIGNVCRLLGDIEKAESYYSDALLIHTTIGDRPSIALVYSNLSLACEEASKFQEALEYNQKALDTYIELNEQSRIALVTGNRAALLAKIDQYDIALEQYRTTLRLYVNLGEQLGIARIHSKLGELLYSCGNIEEAFFHANQALTISTVIKSKNVLFTSHKLLSSIYEYMGDSKNATIHFMEYHKLENEFLNVETIKQANMLEFRRKVADSEKDRLLKVERYKEQERIFHNVLPISIANRLIEGESVIADFFDNVIIFFSDIVDFTKLSVELSPSDLVSGLNSIFTKMDELADKYGLEKIKTIGDSYMAVSGLPNPTSDHAYKAAMFALDVMDSIDSIMFGDNKSLITLRIGLHSGSVVAGIIGDKKFAYDVWGNAVNIASRMETYSESGKIHVSDVFAESIMQHSEFKLTSRGKLEIKGKGLMETYWLERS